MDPAHLTQKVSSVLEISPYTGVHEEKEKMGNDLKHRQNTEAVFHAPPKSQKGMEFLEGAVAT